MPNKAEILKGLNDSGHYGLVRHLNREYQNRLFRVYFNSWASAWLRLSVYMWWAQTFTESGGGGGFLPWIQSIITADNRSAEDEVHELAHFWEDAKVAEGVWTYDSFTAKFDGAVGLWPLEIDRLWAVDFRDGGYGFSDGSFASTASRVIGNIDRLPLALRPYFEALFSGD